MKAELRPYQKYAVNFILEHPAAGLFLDMGLGKTLSTLVAVDDLRMLDELGKTLIIAPKSVALNTWPAEIQKWDDISHLTYSIVVGKKAQRERALFRDVDLYITNRENIVWLVEFYGKKWPFKTVIIDELSSFKSPTAKRFRALRQVRPLMKRVVGLTGTPAPNSLLDLWPEMYLIDHGKRLGKTITGFRQQYFHPGQRSGYIVYNWLPNPGSEQIIYSKIKDVAISMQSSDYLKLPPRTDNTIEVEMSDKEKKIYKKFAKDFVLDLSDGESGTITASNAAILQQKLTQLANGAIYDDDGKVIEFHQHKLDALERIIEEAQGQPILVFYWFQHDRDRILKRFPEAHVLDTSKDDVDRWTKGEIPILLAQPASAGHGLNLQDGGHIVVWFGLTWSPEYYQQANKRLDRSGQKSPVIIHHILTKGTDDYRMLDVVQGKMTKEQALKDAVKVVMEE
ncbi:DEAD/DEAH box helicase [Xylocopilactobacillus apis]|uniref:DEAD/DEAH box helicase n=1 Tax=Xylocopilactobacillus apis TaxID=2932183 RepID=A0AAU9DJA1_9LACO|nr:DEAD/DEAH box helicase [Xylocopilactobacillus apis]BDR56892.1 DEAD/DEAH box helicase [Xylocopilactobacillus apis]